MIVAAKIGRMKVAIGALGWKILLQETFRGHVVHGESIAKSLKSTPRSPGRHLGEWRHSAKQRRWSEVRRPVISAATVAPAGCTRRARSLPR
jgi:hypothetical protein